MKKAKSIITAIVLASALLTQIAMAADYTNSIGMKFTKIPAGSFYMGSCKLSDADKKANKKRQFMGMPAKGAACPSGASTDINAYDQETPQHLVRISKGFQMGTYEVTLGQFKQFVAGAGRDDLLSDEFIEYNSNGDSAAVDRVSWYDAQEFIRWLNKKEGTQAYRLPTEAEWEYAARAGTTTKYSWGNSSSQVDKYAWYTKNSFDVGRKYAKAVGGKQPNPWGLYDMHGNVSEWVQDWYDANIYQNRSANDPKGASSGRSRVLRGGSGSDLVHSLLRSASRFSAWPGSRVYGFGFRLVRQP